MGRPRTSWWQTAQRPVQVASSHCSARRTAGTLGSGVFFPPEPFQGQKRVRHGDEGHMMVPAREAAPFGVGE